MLRSIVRFSLRFPWLVVAVAVALVVLGVTQLRSAPKDLLPEFSPTTVEVQTEALGLSAYEVEQLITVPLEQDLLNGIAFLQGIESASLPGISSIVMTFEPGTSVLDARQVVGERITQAVAIAGLPQVAQPPQMIQPLSSTSRVALVSLSSDELTPIEQSVLARWVIVPRLLGVEGVANVAIWGFRDRQLQVLVDPERLAQEQVELSAVIRSAGNALEVSPLSFLEASSPGTGGFIDTVNQRLHVFHEQAISTPEQLGQVPLETDDGSALIRNGQPVLLGDVTNIVEDHQALIGDARCNDGPCVLLVIEKFPNANTPEVAGHVDDALAELLPGLAGMEIDTSIYRPADFIDTSLTNLGVVFVAGAVLLLIVGLIFFDWRTTVIGAVTLAASLGGAAVVLVLSDVTINAMVLAGVAMAVVAIVDDSISGVGVLVSRAARSHREANGSTLMQTVRDATVEMRRPALYGTLVVAAVLIPFYFTGGELGAFFPTMATTYLIAVVVSLLISLTVAPAMVFLLLRSSGEAKGSGMLSRISGPFVKNSERRASRVSPAIITSSVLVVVALIAVPFLDAALRPSLQEGDIVVRLDGPPGMSLPRMDEIAAEVLDDLSGIPGVEDTAAHVGRAIRSDQIVDVNSAEVWVNLSYSADYQSTIDSIESAVSAHEEVSALVTTYSEQRVDEVIGRSADELVVRIYGEDDQVLLDTAEQVRSAIARLAGAEDAEITTGVKQDAIEILVDLTRAQELGLKPGDIRRNATTLLSGLTVGSLFEEQKVFNVVVWGEPGLRGSVEDVQNLLISTPAGGQVPLGEVADVSVVSSPTVIQHESVSKFVDITIPTHDANTTALAAEIQTELESMTFPLEFHASLLGGFSEQSAATTRVISIAIAAVIAVFLLLQAAFTSWRLATVTLLTLPVTVAGSVLAITLFTRELTLGAIAGMVAILGLGSRWVITLIKRYQELEHRGETFGTALVAAGTEDRLRPILASGAALFVFFLPAMILSGSPGLELVGPMAIAVLGGVITSLVAALYVLPPLYVRWGGIGDSDGFEDDLFAEHPVQGERV